ncbi:hypothetical protein MPL3365_170047 [Mesorhizobium plurifarium]|uniref:Uncharacterized protein n=1 Tax=Mesorhizobium plurifarium TaxID=69974 RepID=A0A090G5C3_MESPL|nr:hypothetical protein MPL3365_170047 [Mesorhizobium plurifarium]
MNGQFLSTVCVTRFRSRGLPGRGRNLDHTQDVAFLHDEQVFAVELDVGAGPLAEQDAVVDLHVEGGELAALIASAWADGNDLAFLRLFLGRVGDDDAAGRLFIGLDATDEYAVMQWTELHVVLLLDKQIARDSPDPAPQGQPGFARLLRHGARAELVLLLSRFKRWTDSGFPTIMAPVIFPMGRSRFVA